VIRGDDVVELSTCEILFRPRFAPVDGHFAAAVVGFDHPTRILGVDPEIVRITVTHAAHGTEGLPAIGRLHERDVVHVDDIRVLGIGVDLRVVPRALAE
jgi:hypothetical protein